MKTYDTDRNGVLDADEFKIFVRDLVLNGKFQFKDDLQQAVDQIAIAAKEDPWADVLRGDSGVRTMIEGLRKVETRRTLVRSDTNTSLGLSDDGSSDSKISPSRSKRHSKDFAGPGGFASKGGAGAPSLFSRCCSLLCSSCCLCIPVLHPDGRLRSLWNVAMALLIIYCGVVVPLEIAFEASMKAGMGPGGWRVWEVLEPLRRHNIHRRHLPQLPYGLSRRRATRKGRTAHCITLSTRRLLYRFDRILPSKPRTTRGTR